MVDKPKLDELLARLRGFVAALHRLGRLPREDFLADPDKLGSAKYHFVIAIECCIDIANHVIASEGYRIPADNADTFVVLAEEGIVDEVQRESLRAMARFRNRLVHLYQEVDDDAVRDYLESSLGDFDAFALAIAGQPW